MGDTQEQSGSLKIEECGWGYEILAARSKYAVSYLRKFVHWGVLREGVEYKKRSGRGVCFHPEKTMTRLAYLWENPDVLREAQKEMASRRDDRKRAEESKLRDRA